MNAAARLARRCIPQRIGPRLTLTFAGLFLLAGSALLGLTYGLVDASLHSTSGHGATKQQAMNVQAKCAANQKDKRAMVGCEQKAFAEGVRTGSSDQRALALDNLLIYSLIGLGIMTLASGGIGYLVARRMLKPVRSITETARRASHEHLGERLALSGPRDELRELADTFDEMLDRLDRSFAAQRQFVANSSHELRTPLTRNAAHRDRRHAGQAKPDTAPA